MTEKEHCEILEKALAVQKCIDSIDMHNEWICHITEKLEKLDVMKLHYIKIWGYTEEEGDTNVEIPLSEEEEVIELVKEKLEKGIQRHKNSIYEEYEKLNSLLK
jgi:hypothetical protein|nr:MAG TPA: hypothetical protein [Caudoviricetes sp.]